MSAILLLEGLSAFVVPKTVFYASFFTALLVDLTELLDYGSVAPAYLYTTLIVATLTLVMSVLAARARTGVSEQSNPMNLPVFG